MVHPLVAYLDTEGTYIDFIGGCLRQCDARLGCGHLCPYKVSTAHNFVVISLLKLGTVPFR